ncbi:SUF system Fe-S cluster assembly regulator [Azospirillum sp. SYSU D00513]|uniref:SUF system Fe-S cluster assembly regulator n=1 Tax=Azospirillum sp. SYSU D00513 TaxID=2812561 RepID=UPI001A95D0A8|nr:SUF system Fe-S cluster assembly regulator [Azospirillum sp. SYSU D00513]
MIRLSKLTDYAIVVMSDMARQAGTVHTVAQIAERTGVPAPTVAKLMKSLTPSGLAVSHRGAAGGYALSRTAEAISIAEIVTALEGPIALTACVDGADSQCDVERLCPMRGGWEKVNSAIRGALEQVSLADMMAPAWGMPRAAPAAEAAVSGTAGRTPQHAA